MKKIMLALCTMSIGFLSAENAEMRAIPENYQAERILKKNYIEAEDTIELFNFLASKIIAEENSSLTAQEAVNLFLEQMQRPEIRNKYLDIYTTVFSQEELCQVAALVSNELYMQYRRPLEQANAECTFQTLNILREIVENGPKNVPVALAKQHEIIHVTSDNYQSLINSGAPVIIDVYADWCGPCNLLAPIFKETSEEMSHIYQFAKLDVDSEMDLATSLNVTAIPTLIFFKNGKEIGREKGFMSKAKLIEKITLHFGESL